MMGLTVFIKAVAHFFIKAFYAYTARNTGLLEACFAHPVFGFGNNSLP